MRTKALESLTTLALFVGVFGLLCMPAWTQEPLERPPGHAESLGQRRGPQRSFRGPQGLEAVALQRQQPVVVDLQQAQGASDRRRVDPRTLLQRRFTLG